MIDTQSICYSWFDQLDSPEQGAEPNNSLLEITFDKLCKEDLFYLSAQEINESRKIIRILEFGSFGPLQAYLSEIPAPESLSTQRSMMAVCETLRKHGVIARYSLLHQDIRSSSSPKAIGQFEIDHADGEHTLFVCSDDRLSFISGSPSLCNPDLFLYRLRF